MYELMSIRLDIFNTILEIISAYHNIKSYMYRYHQMN